jgi:plastocyanin
MRGKFALLTAAGALALCTAGITPAGAASPSSYSPGTYTAGPKSGDASTIAQADPKTGKVMIFQHNTRQAAAVNCVGHGPRATLLAVHHVTEIPTTVVVSYKDAILSDHEIVMDVLVTGDRGGVLGHKADLGPKTNESGKLTVPLRKDPVPGETVTVQFGLQTGQGCLPHPFLLGLDGSRLVNGGEATFTDVSFGAPAATRQTLAPAPRAAQVPADQITGQDHPADVFVEAWQYVPSTIHVRKGQSIKFGNYDMWPYGAGVAAHSLEEAIPGCTTPPYNTNKGCSRLPRFTSGLTDHGYVHKVEGVEDLPPGQYPFVCQVHSQMRGTLIVE